MPSPLFNFLFLVAVIVPIVMYVTGVIILMASLVVKHFHTTVSTQQIEAHAH
jgi:hypothetical protein